MAQTPYQTILQYNTTLKDAVNNTTPLPFGLNDFPSAFLVSTNDSTEELGRLLLEAKYGLLVSLGIDNSNPEDKKLTISFLALDENKQILCSHIKNRLNGEEAWPAQSVTNFPETIDKFDPGNC